MFNKLKSFLRDSIHEFKRVNWPTRRATVRYTLFVIALSLAVALFLGFLDFIFVNILERLV